MELFSFASWGVLSLTVACFVSFLFNQAGVDLGTTVATQLRGGSAGGGDGSLESMLESDAPPSINSIVNVDNTLSIDDSIPECAKDVFLTLHKQEGGDDEHSCRGMLLRDDLILTSYECSKFSFTFDFPGGGILQAFPHPTLGPRSKNTKKKKNKSDKDKQAELLDPRLGFLEVNNFPIHYHFVDKPVARTRMFLSLQSHPISEGGNAVAMTCTDNRPISHNFPLEDGNVLVPLGHLIRLFPHNDEDDSPILWEDTDLPNSYELEELDNSSHRWYTRKVTRDEDEGQIRKFGEEIRGPHGSVSIPDAHNDTQSLKHPISLAAAIGEAIDPRGHRRGDCMKVYYYRWSEKRPFSGMHFFDWLDFGIGRDLLERNETENMLIHNRKDLSCFKEAFNAKTVYYFNDRERDEHEVYLTESEDGTELIARYKLSDELVPLSPKEEPHLYMWDMNERFYIVDNTWDSEKYHTIKHTGVMGGKAALSGGKASFGEHGKLLSIGFSSGHYRPKIPAAAMMYQWIKDKQGLDATAFEWTARTQWTSDNCDKYDWDMFNVTGYDAKELKEACHEVTTSPTWTHREDVRRR